MSAELLNSCMELYDGLAAAMRVIARHDLVDEFIAEARSAGVKDGVGVRAKEAILRVGEARQE